MEIITHKEISARGGKAQWKGLTKEQRKEVMKKRWEVRRKNMKALTNS